MADHDRVGRRRFFRAALGELLKPLEKKAAPLQRALQEFEAIQSRPPAAKPPAPVVRAPAGRTAARPAPPPAWVRPPGALPEDAFRQTCSRCGDCVNVCPVRAIHLEPGGRGEGFPFVDVQTSPCVLCDGLYCMAACPTGALVPTPVGEIDMGTAAWQEPTCARTRHEECTACVDHCPVGSDAIELRDGKIQVHQSGCTGCGVCEHRCPTFPRSITVTPRVAPPTR